MMARIRKSLDEKEKGFTLIELLVVIIIIGILAAIAIPVFLNQRQKGWDAAIKSDLKNAATAEETVLTDTGSYTAVIDPDLTDAGFNYSADGNYQGGTALLEATPNATNAGDDYVLCGISASDAVWVYDSANGGLQEQAATPLTACP